MTMNTSARQVGSSIQWSVALLAGMAIVGGCALLGTLVSNVSVYVFLAQGFTLDEAYARMNSGFASPTQLLSFAVEVISGVCGGIAAANFAPGRPMTHAAIAGAIGASFFLVMFVNPMGQLGSRWIGGLALMTPLLSSLVGGRISVRRAFDA